MFLFFLFFLFDQKYAVRTLAVHEHTYFLFYALLVLMKSYGDLNHPLRRQEKQERD